MHAFMGKILYIDLDAKTSRVESRDAKFFAETLGGAFLAAKLFGEHLAANEIAGAFAPNNPIVFATGPMAGENICGVPRVNLLTISPETTGTYASQAGGEFGPSMKRAGFDAMVITGQSDTPVYLEIENNGDQPTCQFHDASGLWGQSGYAMHDHFGKEGKWALASIGVGGENKVACANLMFEVDHYAGRGGIGAVFGAKRLKAIRIRGELKPTFADLKRAKDIHKAALNRFKEVDKGGFMGVLREFGTFGLVQLNQLVGNVPTRNFSESYPASKTLLSQIDHDKLQEHTIGKPRPCKACFVACKKHYKKGSIHEDKRAVAEYESIALLGPNIGLVDDITEGMRACELCNELGLDTMSMGNLVAWIMDCFEHEILRKEDTDFEIRFGDGKKACELIEAVAQRKGKLGDLLAEGTFKAIAKLGEQTRPYLRASRGIGLPAHMPRNKPGVGFGYLHGPNPSDHMMQEHDWIASDPTMLKELKLEVESPPQALDPAKAEVVRRTQIYYAMADALSTCAFVFGPGNLFSFDEIRDLVNAATGLDYSFDDLMAIGEKCLQLQRKVYVETGGEDEVFLDYLEDEIPSGPSQGQRITKTDFEASRKHYLELWGW